MAQATHVSVTNGTSGQGVVLAQNESSMEGRGFLIKNTDATNSIELLGLNNDGTRQTYGNGYTFVAGKEDGFDLGPGETLYAAAAPGTTVICQVLEVRSVDVGG